MLPTECYLKTLLEYVPNILGMFDKEGELVFCSDSFLRFIGISDIAVIRGWTFEKVYALLNDEEFANGAKEAFAFIQQSSETKTDERRIFVKPEGRFKTFTIESVPMFSDNGMFEGVIVSFLDKTAVLEKETAEQFNAVFEAIPLACSIVDSSRRIVYCNPAARALFRFDNTQDLAEQFYEHRLDYPSGESINTEIAKMFDAAFETGFQRFHRMCLTEDGDPLPTEMTLVRFPWKDDFRLAVFNRDLRETGESGSWVAAMLDNAPFPCAYWNKNYELFDCNQTAVQFYGFNSKDEFVQRFYEVSPEWQPDGKRTIEKVAKYLKLGIETGYHRFEWMHQTLDGDPVPTEVILIRLVKNGEPILLTCEQDLRELRKVEFRLEKERTLFFDILNTQPNPVS
ncbi:MAG: PAS domain-containing protein [Planctomycetaceae bacterium]|jgi:PAS domain-containing protein|nr:PAS domain-containing protein [Planctomycetaceae bacterium]